MQNSRAPTSPVANVAFDYEDHLITIVGTRSRGGRMIVPTEEQSAVFGNLDALAAGPVSRVEYSLG